jgi:hypothetical protein
MIMLHTIARRAWPSHLQALIFVVFVTILHPAAQAQAPAEPPGSFEFKDLDDKSLGLWEGGQPVLVYNHGEIPFQAGRRTRTRASYIHPIHGLDGEVLTDNAPADHFHHHGLFWAWTHVRIADREYNF